MAACSAAEAFGGAVAASAMPQSLPRPQGLTYFQINRELQLNEWQLAEKSLSLAIRFNEKLIVGNIDRQEVVHLRLDSELPFRFTLFVLPQGMAGAATSGRRT